MFHFPVSSPLLSKLAALSLNFHMGKSSCTNGNSQHHVLQPALEVKPHFIRCDSKGESIAEK